MVSQVLGRAWRKLREQDQLWVAGLAALLALLWIFLALADAVGEAETLDVDRAILLAFRSDPAGREPLGPDWLEDTMLNLSALGSGVVVTLLAVTLCGFLVLAGRPRLALLLTACSAGGGLLTFVLKGLFGRARPDLVTPVVAAGGLSFPSGHALTSAALYPMLGALATLAIRGRRLRIYVMAAGVAFAVLIGTTRVYLGVHYPSDVLAGWSLGLAWSLLLGLIARRLQRRGVIEPSNGERATS